MKKLSLLAIVLLGVLVFPSVSWGVMSSTNYTIFADSVDSGGILSTSGTFSLEDTTGESPVGYTTSSTYTVIGGYQAMDWSELEMRIDNTSINLGTLSVSAVATSSATVTITANADSGYVLSVASVSGTSLTAVSDGTVSAGSEEYGVAVSGPDASFGDDRAIAASLNLSSSSTPVTDTPTVLTFKASISSGSTAGARSQSITLTASTSI